MGSLSPGGDPGPPSRHPRATCGARRQGRIAVRHPLEGDFGRPLSHYLSAPDRRLYGVHFWAYPALALPAKLALRLSGGNEFKAFQITNVLFALGALAHVLFLSGLPPGARRLLAALLVTSPFLPFLFWPHPEVVTGALVTSSLVFRHDGRRAAAVLAMALASFQAAPLALAAALLWAEGAWGARGLGWGARLRAVGRLSLALAPVLLPALFALVTFGHPSPLVLAGAYDRRHMSVFRALELLVDPNLGLVPYVPLTLALALVLALVRLARRRAESEERASPAWLLAAVALIALASTGAANWNHGTVGPSRYGLWLLPFLFVLLAEALEGSGGRGRRFVLPLAVLAALSQGAITFARGGLHAPEDYTRHTVAARWVLHHWPALYGPTPEIFIERTEGREINPDQPLTEPVIYRSAASCRKAWVQKRHLAAMGEFCGRLPIEGPDFRQLKARQGPDAWAYVSW